METGIVVLKSSGEVGQKLGSPGEVGQAVYHLWGNRLVLPCFRDALVHETVLLQWEDIGTCTLELQENDMLDLNIAASQCVMNLLQHGLVEVGDVQWVILGVVVKGQGVGLIPVLETGDRFLGHPAPAGRWAQ